MKDTDKITMTVKQLKKLVKESSDWEDDENLRSVKEYDEEYAVMYSLDQIWNQLTNLLKTTEFGSQIFKTDVLNAIKSIESAKQDYWK
jgi:phosphopantothenate synthetase